MLQTFTGGDLLTLSREDQAAARCVFQGDIPSALNILRRRSAAEREAFLAKLAREVVAGKIETINSRGEKVKVLLPPNSILGILNTVEDEEKKSLGELFLWYCGKSQHNWQNVRAKVFQILDWPKDDETIEAFSKTAIKERVAFRNKINGVTAGVGNLAATT